VRELLAGQRPLGKNVTCNNVTYEIIGVVRDGEIREPSQGRLARAVPRLDAAQNAEPGRWQPMGYTYMARVSRGDPMRLAPLIERAIRKSSRRSVPFTRRHWKIGGPIHLNERMMATLGGFFACWR